MNQPEFFINNGNLLCRVEVFDWLSPDEKTSIRFHITEMLLSIEAKKLRFTSALARVDQRFAREWLTKREPNMDYVRALSLTRLKEPVLGAYMPDADRSVVLIDGTHRYMRRYLDGNYSVTYHLIEMEDWLPFAEIKGTWP